IEYATSGYLGVAGSSPAAGRWFTPSEDLAGPQGAAVVGFHTWQSKFASDGGILGRTIRLNGAPVTIIGIGPRDLASATHPTLITDFWLSMSALPLVEAGTSRAGILQRRGDLLFDVRARLKDGVSVEQARATVNVVARRLAADHPDTDPGKGMAVIPSDEVVFHPGEPDRLIALAATALTAVVGLVLAIACSNLATLLLVRGTGRASEVSVRLAIGATRWQLIRHFLTESVLLSMFGAAAGIALAHWSIRYISAQIPFGSDVNTDYRVLVFAVLLSIVTGIAFGLAPALRSTRVNLVSALRGESGGSASFGRGWFSLKNALLAIQVIGSFLLIMSAAVLLRAMWSLQAQEPGFAVQGVALLGTNPRYAGYTDADARRVNQEILRRIQTIPGVQAIFATSGPAVGSSVGREIELEDIPMAQRQSVESAWASPGYFETLQIPLLSGRAFDERDLPDRPRVAIVNETMARQVFGSPNAVGRRFRYGGVQQSREEKVPVEIIGVVRDTSTLRFTTSPEALFYLPVAQAGVEVSTIGARTSSDATSLVQAMQREIRSVDPALPVFQARTMAQQLDREQFLYRRGMALLGGLGAVALLLAAVGLYSVVRFTVVKRAVELGIRLALGASGNQVVWLVVRDVSVLIGISISLGVLLSIGAIRVMKAVVAPAPGVIVDIRGADSITILAVALLMAISAGAAAYFPARRAAHTDPLVTIRSL
ncbi:MAG TPA: ADOP family duplicated permease, partial [Vicinamibacterales bacterium]|nr:ADOP family duplicated permease [Vicinamibacterales bacterium]